MVILVAKAVSFCCFDKGVSSSSSSTASSCTTTVEVVLSVLEEAAEVSGEVGTEVGAGLEDFTRSAPSLLTADIEKEVVRVE